MEGTLSTGMVGQRSLSRMRKWQWWLGKETDTIDSEYHGTERAFILFQKAGKVRTLVMGNLFYSD